MYSSGYKYSNMVMDSVASLMLTYSWLNLIDMPLFTMCEVVCMQTSDIQKDQVPVWRSDVSCVGRTFLYRTFFLLLLFIYSMLHYIL